MTNHDAEGRVRARCGVLRRSTRIIEAAQLMRKHHTGDLIVVDDPEETRVPAGILTDRDIVVEVLANDRDPAKRRLRM